MVLASYKAQGNTEIYNTVRKSADTLESDTGRALVNDFLRPPASSGRDIIRFTRLYTTAQQISICTGNRYAGNILALHCKGTRVRLAIARKGHYLSCGALTSVICEELATPPQTRTYSPADMEVLKAVALRTGEKTLLARHIHYLPPADKNEY